MVTTPEALSSRLASAGITRVAVIDDAFDDSQAVTLAVGVEEFWAEIGLHDDWLAQLRDRGVSIENQDTFATDGLLDLWRNRSAFTGDLADAVRTMFASAEEKLSFPTQVAENLRRLNLSVECFDLPTAPQTDGQIDERLQGVQLVFLDYDLEGHDHIHLGSDDIRSHAIAKFFACRRGDTPFLVLFSSLEGVQEEAERFREKAYYLRGSFLFLKKVDAANFEALCRHLAPSCVWSRDVGHFQHFFVTLRDQLKRVSADVERTFLQLDFQDYAHFQHVALQDDGAPLGEYMLNLFGAVLSHEFRDGHEVQNARAALDRLNLTTQHLPFQTQPTAPLERIYRAVLTEPGISVGQAHAHPLNVGQTAFHLGKERNMPPLLMLGDIFANGPTLPVYLVLNPACDLQYSMPKRPPKWGLSVYLLSGTLEALAVPATKPKLSERMRWLRYRGINYRVLWDLLCVKTVSLSDFHQWQEENRYERIARLSLPYTLALQQSWLANLGRVGLPVSPPIHDAHDLELHIPDLANNCWKISGAPLRQEAIVATHPADSSEPVKFCLTIEARDHLYKTLKEMETLLTGPRKLAATKMLADPTIWWELVTRYSSLVEGKAGRWTWKFKPAGGAAEALLCLWNSNPQQSDFNDHKHCAIVLVLRSSNLIANVSTPLTDPDAPIRQMAYEISIKRAERGMCGDSLSDWLEAEQIVKRSCARE